MPCPTLLQGQRKCCLLLEVVCPWAPPGPKLRAKPPSSEVLGHQFHLITCPLSTHSFDQHSLAPVLASPALDTDGSRMKGLILAGDMIRASGSWSSAGRHGPHPGSQAEGSAPEDRGVHVTALPGDDWGRECLTRPGRGRAGVTMAPNAKRRSLDIVQPAGGGHGRLRGHGWRLHEWRMDLFYLVLPQTPG